MVGSHRADVDEGCGMIEHRVLTHSPIISTHIFFTDARIQKALTDGTLKRPRGREMIPDVTLNANDICGPNQLLPRRHGISCVKEGSYRLVQHVLQDIGPGRTIVVEGLSIPD